MAQPGFEANTVKMSHPESEKPRAQSELLATSSCCSVQCERLKTLEAE